MRHRLCLVALLVLAQIAPGCKDSGIIARGGDFSLSVEQLRFAITKLGPSASYDDTYEVRERVVLNLAARSYLADEAERRGYGGEYLEETVAHAEKTALAEAYVTWKIDKAVMLPRIKTKRWIEKLDRKLHVKDLLFLVRPIAEESLRDIRSGGSIATIEEIAEERQDISVSDMGWLIWKQVPRRIANVIFRLDVGSASEVIASNDGYHIFYLVEDEPFGLGFKLLAARSQRFAEAIEKERLEREMREELAARYDVRFVEDGLVAGLRAFAISFAGERPPDSLMAGVIAEYASGQVSVGKVFGMYFSLPDANRPYIGDYKGLSDFTLEMILPEIQALAGYDLGLERTREVRFAVKKAREEALLPLMEDYFRSQVEVTEKDIEEYYEERRQDLFVAASYRAARIVVSSWEDARRARRQIVMGADFGEVAKQVSEDEHSVEYGGELGWLSEGLIAAYDSVLTGMKPGDISLPFETLSGIEILKLLERKARRYLGFEEAIPDIKTYITNTRANEMLKDFVDAKQEEVGFVIDEDLLRRVSLPPPECSARNVRTEEELEDEEGPSPLPKLN